MLRGMQLPGMLHIECMPHKSFLRQQPNSLLLCTYKAQQEMGTAVLSLCALPMFFKPHLEEYLCAKICKSGFSMPTWWSAFLPLFPSRVTIMVLLLITWTLVPIKTKQSHEGISYGFSISHCPTSNCASEILSTGHVKSCFKTRKKGLGMVVICLYLRNQGNKNI